MDQILWRRYLLLLPTFWRCLFYTHEPMLMKSKKLTSFPTVLEYFPTVILLTCQEGKASPKWFEEALMSA